MRTDEIAIVVEYNNEKIPLIFTKFDIIETLEPQYLTDAFGMFVWHCNDGKFYITCK